MFILKTTAMSRFIFVFSFFFVLEVCYAQKVIKVSINATGSNTGASWLDAYNDLHLALANAESGDSVFIKEGIYTPHLSDRSKSFTLNPGIHIFGGFKGTETFLSERTGNSSILSGSIGNQLDTSDNSFTILRVFSNQKSSIIDGFIFEYGHAYSSLVIDEMAPENCGGAVYISTISNWTAPVFRNCIFRKNFASSNGGAIFIAENLHGNSNATFDSCAFENNYAGKHGGAVFGHVCDTLGYFTSFKGCEFVSNRATVHGGGFFLNTTKSFKLDLRNTHFYRDTSLKIGAAFFVNMASDLDLFALKMDSSRIESCVGSVPGFFVNNIFFTTDSLQIDLNHVVIRENNFISQGARFASVEFIRSKKSKCIVWDCLIENDSAVRQADSPFLALGDDCNFDSIKFIGNRFLNQESFFFVLPTGTHHLTILNNYFKKQRVFRFFGNMLISQNVFDGFQFGSIQSGNLVLQNNCFIGELTNFNLPASTGIGRDTIVNNTFTGFYDFTSSPIIPYQFGQFDQSVIRNNFTDVPCVGLATGLNCDQFTYIPNLHQEFKDYANSDFRLKECSFLVDKGVSMTNLPKADFLGNTRVIGGAIDIGPYESQSGGVVTQAQVSPVICGTTSGGSVQLTISGGTPPYITSWKDVSLNTNTRSQLSVGVYTASIKDAEGCKDKIMIDVPKTGSLILLPNALAVSCFGDSTGSLGVQALSGKSPFEYLWNTSDTFPLLTQIPAGGYSVTVVDALGCTKTEQFNLNQPDSVYTVSQVIQSSGMTSANGSINIVSVSGGISPYHFKWSNGDTTSNINNLLPGQYQVTITDANSCVKQLSYMVSYPNALTNPLSLKQIDVMPNPAHDYFVLEQPEYEYQFYQLYDMKGLEYISGRLQQSQLIDTSQLSDGNYTLKLVNGFSTKSINLVVLHK
jgi:predicted outer membrane repeat protein